jgi:hypothetical protein
MSDAQYVGLWLVGALTVWMTLSLLATAIWAVIAHRPDPWDRLPERMRAAGEWDNNYNGGTR